ncbi:MAG: divalent-cation tolerance protein CutA [bacterium]|nr:divalent-cation tolerance protein CutA [bacterium]
MKSIIIYITYPNLKEAKRVTEALLKERLIACANYFPVESVYRWLATSLASDGSKGKIENAKEVVSILKTKKSNWMKIKKVVEALHPYETPCIMKLEVESNKAFANWIEKETQ